MKRRWTPEEDAQLHAFVMAGLRRNDIATRFPSHSARSVHYRMHRLRLRARDGVMKDPFDRYVMAALGHRVGKLRSELSPAVKMRIAACMEAHGLPTVAAAVNYMLSETP